MRRLRYCFLMFALMLPTPGMAQTTADSGFACQNDTQCMKVDNKCGGIAINRAFVDDYAPIAQNLECQGHATLSPKDVARCVDGACALVHLSDAEFRDEWPKCVKGDGCAVTYDGCEDVAVNSKYMDFITPSKTCKEKSVPHDPDAHGKCVNNVCTIKTHDQPK